MPETEYQPGNFVTINSFQHSYRHETGTQYVSAVGLGGMYLPDLHKPWVQYLSLKRKTEEGRGKGRRSRAKS